MQGKSATLVHFLSEHASADSPQEATTYKECINMYYHITGVTKTTTTVKPCQPASQPHSQPASAHVWCVRMCSSLLVCDIIIHCMLMIFVWWGLIHTYKYTHTYPLWCMIKFHHRWRAFQSVVTHMHTHLRIILCVCLWVHSKFHPYCPCFFTYNNRSRTMKNGKASHNDVDAYTNVNTVRQRSVAASSRFADAPNERSLLNNNEQLAVGTLWRCSLLRSDARKEPDSAKGENALTETVRQHAMLQ